MNGMSVTRNGDMIEIDGLDASQTATVVVGDVQGRTLKKAYVNGQSSIDLRSLGSGACFVSVKNGMGAETRMTMIRGYRR